MPPKIKSPFEPNFATMRIRRMNIKQLVDELTRRDKNAFYTWGGRIKALKSK